MDGTKIQSVIGLATTTDAARLVTARERGTITYTNMLTGVVFGALPRTIINSGMALREYAGMISIHMRTSAIYILMYSIYFSFTY